MGLILLTCIRRSLHALQRMCVSTLERQTGALCTCPRWTHSVCVDVGCMYYAVDLAERGAINKTGLQCAHWQNNLSDSMEKEMEDKAKCAGKERRRQGECKTDEVKEKKSELEIRACAPEE